MIGSKKIKYSNINTQNNNPHFLRAIMQFTQQIKSIIYYPNLL